jgi:hypothetical protein
MPASNVGSLQAQVASSSQTPRRDGTQGGRPHSTTRTRRLLVCLEHTGHRGRQPNNLTAHNLGWLTLFLVRLELWAGALAALPAESRSRLRVALVASLGNVLLVHPIKPRLCLNWESSESIGSEEVYVTVISVFDGDHCDDLNRCDDGFFENLVGETVRRTIASGAEVDLATNRQIAV